MKDFSKIESNTLQEILDQFEIYNIFYTTQKFRQFFKEIRQFALYPEVKTMATIRPTDQNGFDIHIYFNLEFNPFVLYSSIKNSEIIAKFKFPTLKKIANTRYGQDKKQLIKGISTIKLNFVKNQESEEPFLFTSYELAYRIPIRHNTELTQNTFKTEMYKLFILRGSPDSLSKVCNSLFSHNFNQVSIINPVQIDSKEKILKILLSLMKGTSFKLFLNKSSEQSFLMFLVNNLQKIQSFKIFCKNTLQTNEMIIKNCFSNSSLSSIPKEYCSEEELEELLSLT